MSKLKKAIAPICIAVVLGIVIASAIVVDNQTQATKPKPTPTDKPKSTSTYKPTRTYKPASSRSTTRTQTTTANTFKKQFSAWDGSHYKTVKYVKNVMKDPRSFKHVETKYLDYASDKGYRVIIMKYRGKNSFNAVVTNTIAVKVKLNGDVSGVIAQ